jgi:hypothetical protein
LNGSEAPTGSTPRAIPDIRRLFSAFHGDVE